jgi:hypothetical protein
VKNKWALLNKILIKFLPDSEEFYAPALSSRKNIKILKDLFQLPIRRGSENSELFGFF